jgi:hypothetical protein
MNRLSADNEPIRQGNEEKSGVVLRGPDGLAKLTASEARGLADEIRAKWPELANQLCEAADSTDRMTRFDGPLGLCNEIDEEPGNYERAQQMIAALDRA